MLVLSLKHDDTVYIGDNIEVTCVRIGPNTVRLGFTAPANIPIDREVVHLSKMQDALNAQQNLEAAGIGSSPPPRQYEDAS